jgi:hypothetical protein
VVEDGVGVDLRIPRPRPIEWWSMRLDEVACYQPPLVVEFESGERQLLVRNRHGTLQVLQAHSGRTQATLRPQDPRVKKSDPAFFNQKGEWWSLA